MKRGGPIKRKPFARLRSGGVTLPGRGRSTKALQIPDDVRQLVLLRDGGICQRCTQWAHDIQHRQARQMGGSRDERINCPSNLISVCRTCHMWMESYVQAANALGFSVRRPLDPAQVRVFVRGTRWTYLTPAGGFSDLPPATEGTTP